MTLRILLALIVFAGPSRVLAADSYWELDSDANLQNRWNGDGNGDTTADAQDAVGSANGTWVGGSAYITDPYGGSLAFDCGVRARYIDTNTPITDGSNTTLSAWVQFEGPTNTATEFTLFSDYKSSTGTWGLIVRYDSAANQWDALGANNSNGTLHSFNSGTVEDGAWHHVAVTFDGSNCKFYLDGSQVGSDASETYLPNADGGGHDAFIGYTDHEPGDKWEGNIFDLRYYDRALSSAEIAQEASGPEPTYTSGASIDESGNYSVGTWASHSNGTVAYVVSAVNAAGDVLGSDTTATGTIDISSASGAAVYLVVRASNDGGYRVGDKATRTSGFGSSGDGYYEVASVNEGGGPSTSIPVLMHHYRGMRR